LAAVDALLDRFPMSTTNTDTILQPGDPGNTIRLVVGSDSAIIGRHLGVLSSEAFDAAIMDFASSPLVWTNDLFMWVDGGIANLSFHEDNTVVQIDMNEEVFWHDGTPLTLDDLVFAYEFIALDNYHDGVGVRYSATFYIPWIIGIEEFRSGQTDSIEGMVLSNNNRTLRIYYDRQLPPAAQYGGGIWMTPIPRHWLAPVVEEIGHGPQMAEHPRARHEVLGWGPWIIDSIVPGESVLFRANDNYWRGRPLADYLLYQIRPNEVFMAAVREGEYDIVIQGMPAVHFEEHLLFNPNNYTILGQPAPSTGFMYFRTGTFIDNWATPRPDGWHPIQDVNIRRALAHAMPQQLIADTIQNGLSVPAGTVLTPFNARPFITDDVGEGFFFDLAHASQILDDAGYTERGPDGFRLNLDGQPMFFNFAANDNAFNQQAVPTYLQMWRDIGLDVRLFRDDLIVWPEFVENLLLSDNWSDDVHLFISNWSLGWNPAPHGLWAPDENFNLSRHNTEEMRAILDDIASQDAFDFDFLRNAYIRWQQYFYENAVANHMFWGVQLMPVNNRVANFSLERFPGHNGVTQSSHLWGLTAPTGYANTN
jgi:peptide/nickel transport system substrate-binding protein